MRPIIAACALLVGTMACNDDGDPKGEPLDTTTEGQGTQEPGDTATASQAEDEETAEDTADDFVPWVYEDGDPDKTKYEYGPDYAPGPYGFKGGLCWTGEGNQLSYDWGGGGDTVHDLCLPNHEGKEVCLHDYYGGEHDLLILNVTARWCPICNSGAQQEKKWLEDLRELGYNPVVITLMSNGAQQMAYPTEADAKFWKTRYALEGEVLVDADMAWADKGMIDTWYVGRRTQGLAGFPFYYYIHTSNMKVWDSFEGFPMTFQYKQWFNQEKEILAYCDGQPGAKAE